MASKEDIDGSGTSYISSKSTRSINNSDSDSTHDRASYNADIESGNDNVNVNSNVNSNGNQRDNIIATSAIDNDSDHNNDDADLDIVGSNQPHSISTLKTAQIDVVTGSHASTFSIEKEKEIEASSQQLVPQGDATNLERIGGHEQSSSACIAPRDEDISDDKEIDVDPSEGGKITASPTTNMYEQDTQQSKPNHNHNNSNVKLAIARAVPYDGNGDDELPYGSKKMDIKQVATPAPEYDPDDERNKSFCRRHAMIAGGCGILGIALIVLLTILLLPSKAKCSDTSICQTDTLSITMAPTVSPTEISRESIIIDFLVQELSPKVLVEGTSYSMAVDWILHHDRRQLDVDMDRDLNLLMQRYALAVFYFSSTRNGSTPWRSCNPSYLSSSEEHLSAAGTNDSAIENINTCTFLEHTRSPDGSSIVYNGVPGKIRWLSSLHECEWQGVLCDENVVIMIDVAGQGIQRNLGRLLAGDAGPVEEDVNDVSNVFPRAFSLLKAIDFSYNNLTGTIPASFARFSDLKLVELIGNSLTGEIPMSLFDNLTSLQQLNLGENRLSGRLDTKIGQLTELRGLHLHQNNFQGQLPSEIGKLSPLLTHSRFDGNEFAGQLPTEIGRLTSLIEFQYSNNLFTGTIPTQFGQLTNVDVLRLDGNKLSGTIPVELCNLTNSRAILLDNNALTGPLPTVEISQLKLMIRFQVNNNQLTGPIPSQLGDLLNLRLAWLHLNQFTGAMPNEVCEVGVSFLQTDCAPTDNPPNPCRCCSACCDRSTGICVAAI